MPGVDLERRRDRPVEHRRRSVTSTSTSPVASAGLTVPSGRGRTRPVDLEDPLGAHLLGDDERGAGDVRVEDELDEAGAVAQVQEDETAVVAAAVHPAGERDGLADLLRGAARRRRGVRIE